MWHLSTLVSLLLVLYPKNINRLISESGNKVALFAPRTTNNKEILTEAECARWLLTFQGYTGLSDKVIFGEENTRLRKAGSLISEVLP